jgi:hypothetical protein
MEFSVTREREGKQAKAGQTKPHLREQLRCNLWMTNRQIVIGRVPDAGPPEVSPCANPNFSDEDETPFLL